MPTHQQKRSNTMAIQISVHHAFEHICMEIYKKTFFTNYDIGRWTNLKLELQFPSKLDILM